MIRPGTDPQLATTWVCEGCSSVVEGVSPPDICPVCEHEFFESFADVELEARQAKQH